MGFSVSGIFMVVKMAAFCFSSKEFRFLHSVFCLKDTYRSVGGMGILEFCRPVLESLWAFRYRSVDYSRSGCKMF